MLIELGGGTNPHPQAAVVIDTHHPRHSPPQDASQIPWQRTVGTKIGWFPTGSVDEVYCSHFLEHIESGTPRINVFNEAWRVLKPGGLFKMVLPLIGYTDPYSGQPMSNQIGWQPWADPTHVSQWWFPESLLYFCAGPFKPHADYGISEWAPLGEYRDPEAFDLGAMTDSHWGVRDQWEGVAVLVKP